MRTFDERSQIRSVAARWKQAYPNDRYKLWDGKQAGEIHAALLRLDPETASAQDVAEVIGNPGWVAMPTCHECGAETWECVELGEPPEYESSTAMVCRSCITKALATLEPKP